MTIALHGGKFYNSYGSVVVALGHVGAIMLIVQSGALELADADDWRPWGEWRYRIT